MPCNRERGAPGELRSGGVHQGGRRASPRACREENLAQRDDRAQRNKDRSSACSRLVDQTLEDPRHCKGQNDEALLDESGR